MCRFLKDSEEHKFTDDEEMYDQAHEILEAAELDAIRMVDGKCCGLFYFVLSVFYRSFLIPF